MLQIFTLAILIFAENDTILLHEQKIEKIDEVIDFSQREVEIEIENTNDHVENATTEADLDDFLETLEPEMDLSFEGEVAFESAKILSAEMAMEEELDEVNPTYEDLSDLVANPQTTMAEETNINLYESLPITIEDKIIVGKILMTMAENNVIKLLFERKRLESMGDEIRHVHPLRFLGTIFTNPRLVHCMYRIRSSSFKWGGFVDGFSEHFKAELEANNVLAYLPGFAESVGVDLTMVEGHVKSGNFEALILYLMRAKSQ